MKVLITQDSSAKMMINSDLAEAKHVIIITNVEGTKRAALAESMAIQFSELEQRYASAMIEEKLLLLALALNLMLYAFTEKHTEKELQLKQSVSSHYQHLFIHSNLPLTALQKAKWSSIIANVHRATGYRMAARDYYQQAIIWAKAAIKTTKDKLADHSLLFSLYNDSAALYADTAIHYETNQPAPDLAYQAYQGVIKACEAALLLAPEPMLAMQLTLMKVNALNKLALANCQHKHKPTAARNYWCEVLTISFNKIKLAHAETKLSFLSAITAALEGLITLSKQPNEKENSFPFIADLEKACDNLKNCQLNNVLEIEPFINQLSCVLSPALSSTPFWQKTSSNFKEEKTSNPASSLLLDTSFNY